MFCGFFDISKRLIIQGLLVYPKLVGILLVKI